MKRNRKSHPIIFWEECLAVIVYKSMLKGDLEYSSTILYQLLGEFTLETIEAEKRASWWAQKIRNVKSAVGDGPPSANEGTLVHIRAANNLLAANPSEAITLAQKALIRPLPDSLSSILFKKDIQTNIFQESKVDYGQRSAVEGNLKLELHLVKERSGRLTEMAKSEFRKIHSGYLFCEACSFNPESSFGHDIIEAHHRIPLSKLKKPRKNSASDFIMLCPNCHRTIHQIDNCDFQRLQKIVSK